MHELTWWHVVAVALWMVGGLFHARHYYDVIPPEPELECYGFMNWVISYALGLCWPVFFACQMVHAFFIVASDLFCPERKNAP